MEFLKELLGDDLFGQVKAAIEAHNGKEENAENQIKIGNLGRGEYVSKGKYEAEINASKNKDVEIENYKTAIADLQKASKGNEAIQQRISLLEDENERLKKEQQESDTTYAFNVLLMDAGVADKDKREFLIYTKQKQLAEKGETLALDENKHIKGGDEIVETLRTTYSAFFATGETGDSGFKPLGDGKLPKGDLAGNKLTKSELLKKPYAERMELYSTNPEAYKAAMSS